MIYHVSASLIAFSLATHAYSQDIGPVDITGDFLDVDVGNFLVVDPNLNGAQATEFQDLLLDQQRFSDRIQIEGFQHYTFDDPAIVPQFYDNVYDPTSAHQNYIESFSNSIRDNSLFIKKLGISSNDINGQSFAELRGFAVASQNRLLINSLNISELSVVNEWFDDHPGFADKRAELLLHLSRVMPQEKFARFSTPQELMNELRNRGFIKGFDFMIFDGEDISPAEKLIIEENDPPDRNFVASPSFNATTQETGTTPDLVGLVVARSATALIATPDPAINPWTIENGILKFQDVITYDELVGGFPLCDRDQGAEPVFGLCTGVLVNVPGSAEPRLVTAGHCLGQLADGIEAFAVFDYDESIFSENDRTLNSRKFAKLVNDSIIMHEALDIASAAVVFNHAPAPEAVSIANLANLSVGDAVGAFGHPFGRPKKAIFGDRVRVSTQDASTFGAFVDNFSKSSGSPIVTYTGNLLGILTYQSDPKDFTTITPETGNDCQIETIVSSLTVEPPRIVKISELP